MILPADNRKDAEEIPETVRKQLKLVFLDHVDKVIDLALLKTNRRNGTGGDAANGSRARLKPQMRIPVSSVN